MLTLNAALDCYHASIRKLPTEHISTSNGLHRVLRGAALSAVDLPPFTQSAMDGYAVRSAEAVEGASLPVAITLAAAGRESVPDLPTAACARIFTGGPVPIGADAVVMQERVERDGEFARFTETTPSGKNIRQRAEEIAAGGVVCRTGERVTPGRIGAMTAAGVGTIEVARQPRVTLLVTGDEIVPAGTPLRVGQVYDCNTPMVSSWLAARGIQATVDRLPDNRDATEAGVLRALDCSDLVLTTGGVSVGEKDFVIGAARSAGVEDRFWKVAQKPGKPLYFGTREDCAFLGLPGNPAAVFIGLHVHVARILDIFSGEEDGDGYETGVTTTPLRRSPDRTIWHRCASRSSPDGGTELVPLGGQASHMLGNLSSCTALARIDPGSGRVEAGELVPWLSV
jgi:molybdopterin molybdotransferase